ncbi:MAG: hypothetical protein WAT93_05020, partial [Pontixanthobacter sp.]
MGRFGRGSFVAGMLLLFGMIASSTAQAPVEPLGPERRAEAKLSCDGGDLQACFLFGRDLANQQAATSEGDEIIHNVLGKACLGGVFEACYGFGNYKLIGVGADMDEAEARKMFDRGCQGGDAKSCQALQRFDAAPLNAARLSKAEWPLRRRINAAVYIIDDKGKMLNELASFETFSRDNILAAKMRETACDMGNPEACWVAARYMLGMDEHPYFLQRGVRYADRACMGGEAKGCKLRDSFQDKKLTPMGNPAKWGS